MATRIISTKLAIDGESEYRAALSKINTEIKTLQSSLKLTESQYQTNANSMQALTAKGEALSNLYKAQQQKVESLKSALDNAKKAEETYASQKAALIAKIEENNKKLEALKNTTGDTSKEEKALTEENKALNEQLDKCDANLTAAEKGVNSWQTQLNSAEIKLNDLDAEIQLNNEYLGEAKNSADGCATSIDRFGDRIQETADQASELKEALVSAGVIAALEKTAEAFEACVNSAADFEYTMSSVAAISSASSEDMEKLNAKAKEIGASTMYTAQQAGEALSYMALAGWSAEEMLAGVDGVISLAAASGEDLARVSDIVTDALTAFGLSASDSGHFVDVLAATAANSNTTVNMLGEAFKYAAPLAGALGYSIEDVAVAMGLMANNGVKSSMAGTTLRTMLTNLSGEVTLTAAAFGEVEISAANADGTIKPLSESLDELRYYFSQMTDAEKLQNAEAVAGKRAMSGLTAIMNSTQEDYDSLTATIRNCTGAAKDMADVRMDNLTGQVTLMQSAFDAVKIAIGEKLTPTLKNLASAATDGLSWMADVITKSDTLVPIVTTVATVVGVLAAAIVGYTAVTKLAAAATALLTAEMDANPIFLVVSAVAALAAGLAVLITTLNDVNSSVPTVSELAEAAESLPGTVTDLQKACDDAVAAAEGTATQARIYIDLLAELEEQGLDTAEAQETYKLTVDKLNAIMPELNLTIDEQTGHINSTIEALYAEVDAWEALAIKEALMTRYTDTIQAYADAESEILVNRAKLTIAEREGQSLEEQIATTRENLQAIGQQQIDLMAEETDNVYEQDQAYWDLEQQWNDTYDTLMDLETALDENQQYQENLTEAITEGEETVGEYQSAVDEATEALKLYEEEQAAAADATEDAAGRNAAAEAQIREDLEKLAQSYKDAYDAAYSSISGQTGLFNEFTAEISEDVDTVEEMMQRWAEQTAALSEYTENLKLAGQYGLDDGLVASLSDGSAESAAYLAVIIGKIEELGGSTEGMSTDAAAFVEDFNASFAETEQAKESFAETAAAIQTDFADTITALETEAAAVNFDKFTEAFNDAFANVGLDGETIGNNLGLGLSSGIEGSTGTARGSAESMAEEVTDGTRDTFQTQSPSKVFKEIGENLDEGLVEGIDGHADDVVSSVEDMANDVIDTMEHGAKDAVDQFDSEFSKITGKTQSRISELKSAVNSSMSSMPNDAYSVGQQIVNGMINGIYNRSGSLYWAVSYVVNNAIASARAAAAVASPSKKTTEIFEYVGEGMIVGIENRRKALEEKMQDVVDSALDVDVENNISDRITSISDSDPTGEYIRSASAREIAATSNTTITRGDTIINVYGAKGQDERKLAHILADLINDDVGKDSATWA